MKILRNVVVSPSELQMCDALRAAASGGNVRGDLPLRTPQRGKRQIRSIPSKSVRAGRRDNSSLRRPPPAAPAKDGSGRFMGQ